MFQVRVRVGVVSHSGPQEVRSTPVAGSFRAAAAFVGPRSRGFHPRCLWPSLPASPSFRIGPGVTCHHPSDHASPSTTPWAATRGPPVHGETRCQRTNGQKSPTHPPALVHLADPLPTHSHAFPVTPRSVHPTSVHLPRPNLSRSSPSACPRDHLLVSLLLAHRPLTHSPHPPPTTLH